jgi:hypothetical protein
VTRVSWPEVKDRSLASLLIALLALVALPALTLAEVSQRRGVRVSVDGKLVPSRLPRQGVAPVSIAVSVKLGATTATAPPQLRTLTIAINRHGHLSYLGLPRCRLGRIDPSTTGEARAACRNSLVGEGHFSADVHLPEQSPFPSQGKVLAFNGTLNGRPVVFAHIYGTKPVPTSYVLPFTIGTSGGAFGTVLTTSLPRVTGDWGFVTGISMSFDRRFGSSKHGFLSAGCPAPKGLFRAAFPLMRVGFGFDDGLNLASTVTKTCSASRQS